MASDIRRSVLACCLPLNCDVFSRRLSSSALSNPSWQSSPSSCRPLANITTEISSERRASLCISFVTYQCHEACLLFMCAWKQFGDGDNYITSSQSAWWKCSDLFQAASEGFKPCEFSIAYCPSCVTAIAIITASWVLFILQLVIQKFFQGGLQKRVGIFPPNVVRV